jgi:hypothetical protein
MPVTVVCDNCGKKIGDFVWEDGFSAGLKEDIQHVSCRRHGAPNGMLVACSRECAIILDDKYPRDEKETQIKDDGGLDRVFGPMGVS